MLETLQVDTLLNIEGNQSPPQCRYPNYISGRLSFCCSYTRPSNNIGWLGDPTHVRRGELPGTGPFLVPVPPPVLHPLFPSFILPSPMWAFRSPSPCLSPETFLTHPLGLHLRDIWAGPSSHTDSSGKHDNDSYPKSHMSGPPHQRG